MGGSENPLLLSEAFQTVPAGFSANSQSFETSRGPSGTFRLSDDCTFSATTGRVTCLAARG